MVIHSLDIILILALIMNLNCLFLAYLMCFYLLIDKNILLTGFSIKVENNIIQKMSCPGLNILQISLEYLLKNYTNCFWGRYYYGYWWTFKRAVVRG